MNFFNAGFVFSLFFFSREVTGGQISTEEGLLRDNCPVIYTTLLSLNFEVFVFEKACLVLVHEKEANIQLF